jgi:hypothetical protein
MLYHPGDLVALRATLLGTHISRKLVRSTDNFLGPQIPSRINARFDHNNPASLYMKYTARMLLLSQSKGMLGYGIEGSVSSRDD